MMKSLLLSLFVVSFALQTHAQVSRLGGQKNAVWVGSIFLRGFDPTTGEKLSDGKLKQLAERLKSNSIRYVYLFAGPFQKDGSLPAYAFSQRARESVSFLKKSLPGLKVLCWIGGVQGKTVSLNRPEWREASLSETVKLLAAVPFDGVHTDLEYVLFPKRIASNLSESRYDAEWLQFHEQLREKIPRAFISTSVVASAPGTKPWKHKQGLKDLLKISRVVNQLAFMFYDTHLDNAAVYRENMRLQLEQIKKMKVDLGDQAPDYLFGIGTFKGTRALRCFRDMRFENVGSTLTLLNEFLGQLPFSGHLVDGLAIYSDWTTTPPDWKQIRNLWMNN